MHIDSQRAKDAQFLFQSGWKKAYSTRGVRAMLARYAEQAGLAHNMPPHRLRRFLFTWLKTPGHRRRPHPALLRPRQPPIAGDLLAIAITDDQHSHDAIDRSLSAATKSSSERASEALPWRW